LPLILELTIESGLQISAIRRRFTDTARVVIYRIGCKEIGLAALPRSAEIAPVL
jgi:hypothetical protein